MRELLSDWLVFAILGVIVGTWVAMFRLTLEGYTFTQILMLPLRGIGIMLGLLPRPIPPKPQLQVNIEVKLDKMRESLAAARQLVEELRARGIPVDGESPTEGPLVPAEKVLPQD